MPTLSRFTNNDLPVHFAHQIRDATGEDLKPVYFVMADDPALFSHAAAETRAVECNSQTYSCSGLSTVFTYPAFRNRLQATKTA